MTKEGAGGSHPVIRFESLPIVKGPLSSFEEKRPQIILDTVKRTHNQFHERYSEVNDLERLIGEANYLEKLRIRKLSQWRLSNVFITPRIRRDRRFWSSIQSGIISGPAGSDRRVMLERSLHHYAEEIGGHFNPAVYWLAVKLVPWSFNWLLNAASVKHFKPWGMTESLESRLRIVGEIPHLQALSKKGTILLVPTHQSNIDSVVIGYIIYLMSLPPFAYGAGLNLFSNPVLSFFMSGLGAYTVDRMKNSELYKGVLKNYSSRILEEGVHSIFFPGGGRARSGAIESKIKLGLLGTGLQAQVHNLIQNKANPKVFVVPMVISYDFVLEASSLIEQYLVEQGQHRFLGVDSEPSLPLAKAAKFFWKFFKSQSGMTARVCPPMDVFGNKVDMDGNSMGPAGQVLDTRRWLMSRGEVCEEPQRDHEYTRELGARIVDSYYRGNTVLPSHLVALVYFQALRRKYPELDLFRFLRLTLQQRSLPYEKFLFEAEAILQKAKSMHQNGELVLCHELLTQPLEEWVKEGVKQLGVFHEASVLKMADGTVFTEDMQLLYYYRNRMSGYGFTFEGENSGLNLSRGDLDEKGFLA